MGRLICELENVVSAEELIEWRAFWALKAEAEEKRLEKSKRGAEKAPKRRGRKR